MSKTINLTKVKVLPGLGEPEKELNLAKEIGDAIYRNSRTIPELDFGRKLYYSEGDIEASDEEIKFIREAAKGFFAWAQVAVNEILDK